MNERERSRQSGGIGRHLPALAIFVVVTVLLTWPLASRMDDTFISWGDPVFQAWTIAWDWHALKSDPLSIFDANVFYPWANTLAYSDHLFGQALTVLPVIALTENGILADNIATLLAFFFSALAMYLLVYDMTGNRIAGILAGVAYAFAPSRVAHLEHLHLLSAQWPPLMLLCLRRICVRDAGRGTRYAVIEDSAVDYRRVGTGTAELVDPRVPRPVSHVPPPASRAPWFLGLGACFFAQGLFGVYFLYFSIVMLIIVGAVYAAFALFDRDWEVMRALGLAALTCAFAGALLIPTLLPYWRVSQDLDVERTTEEVSVWSAEPTDYLAVWPRARAWNELLDRYHRDVERDLFPGLAILALAGIGLTHRGPVGSAGCCWRWQLVVWSSPSVSRRQSLAAMCRCHIAPSTTGCRGSAPSGFRRVSGYWRWSVSVGWPGLASIASGGWGVTSCRCSAGIRTRWRNGLVSSGPPSRRWR